MAFIEQRLPDCIAFGATFGPEYQTNVVVVNSGHENRNINWAKARLVANIGYRNRPEADTQALIAWFRSMKGRAHGFRVRDWSDYKVDAQTGMLKALPSQPDVYQLCKAYEMGDLSELREIRKPVAGLQLFDADGVQLPAASYNIDTTNGVVEMLEYIPDGEEDMVGKPLPTYWVGEFDVPARFDVDKLELEVSDRSANGLVYSWPSIPLIELRG